ncbi:hypothetical protein JKP88DRAFT_347481 [Tribonema minus]|uniref:Uncharacterized protein n=1 Tax=Tribonema minus TaxID=303371 RepID=A0A835ZF51_9STRA|nr:hypothetical protein JKP88DRAFT_347481 [Tribonema minus]
MSSWCCRESTGMVPSLPDELETELRQILHYYPGTHYTCLMDAAGRRQGGSSLTIGAVLPHPLVTGSFTSDDVLDAPPDKFCTAVSSLHNAAVQFARTLDQMGCSVMHIAGDQHLFSCYEVVDKSQPGLVNPWILAFYTTSVDGVPVSAIDTRDADEGVKKIVAALESMLAGVMTPPANSSPPISTSALLHHAARADLPSTAARSTARCAALRCTALECCALLLLLLLSAAARSGWNPRDACGRRFRAPPFRSRRRRTFAAPPPVMSAAMCAHAAAVAGGGREGAAALGCAVPAGALHAYCALALWDTAAAALKLRGETAAPPLEAHEAAARRSRRTTAAPSAVVISVVRLHNTAALAFAAPQEARPAMITSELSAGREKAQMIGI